MMRSKLKRRLRKKNRIADFQELGFHVSINFKPHFTEPEFDRFTDDFIDKIEEFAFSFGGGGDTRKWEGFVTASKSYQSPTEAQRGEIEIWLRGFPEISELRIGNLVDAWYD